MPDKPVGTGKKRGRPSKAVMKEREEAKRARGELPEPTPKDKQPKKRGRKPKIDWSSMSEEVCKVFIITIIIRRFQSITYHSKILSLTYNILNIAKRNIKTRKKSGTSRKTGTKNERT